MSDEETTKRLSRYLAKPRTLKDICMAAGKPDAYERVRLALYRHERGKGKGLSDEDGAWIQYMLDVLEGFDV